MSRVRKLLDRKILKSGQVPKFFPDGIQYETIMGSSAYGVSTDNSDLDIYGWCIPPKSVVFPHTVGYIPGFGTQPEKFEQWQLHHVKDEENVVEYDFQIFSIVNYFSLCMANNPNVIDSLFTPHHCITHISPIAQIVRDNRKIFLHKGSWHKFKGYAFSQMSKMKSKEPPTGKRKEIVEKFGFDLKYGYHLVRLISEVEQILTEGDLDLLRNKEMLKAIRAGDWTLEQIEDYFTTKEKHLEEVYLTSTLQHSPDEKAIKQLLMDCLEHYYGSLKDSVVNVDSALVTLRKVQALIEQELK